MPPANLLGGALKLLSIVAIEDTDLVRAGDEMLE